MDVPWDRVCARRLLRQHLATPTGADPAAVAAAILGAHAQVMSAAQLCIGLRSRHSAADVRAALWQHRTLVKTFGPRGTVHLLPVADLPTWTGALSALPPRENLPAGVQLDPAQTGAVLAALDDALRDAELTVDELTAALVERVGAVAGERTMPAFGDRWPRWRQLTALAAARGLLCFGPDRGRQVTYTSPRRWLPRFAPLPAGPALAALARAWLRAYGPATAAHFGQWLGAPRDVAVSVFDALGAELQPVSLAGATAWVLAGDCDFPAPAAPALRLLGHFDPYAIGCHPRDRVFPGYAGQRALSRGAAGTLPVVLVGGVVAGVWQHRRAGRRLAVTVELFDRPSAAQRLQLDEQVQRVGQVVDAEPALTLGPVTVGHHA